MYRTREKQPKKEVPLYNFIKTGLSYPAPIQPQTKGLANIQVYPRTFRNSELPDLSKEEFIDQSFPYNL